MADVDINKFRASVVRDGSKPSSPGFIVSEGQDPVNPPGTNNYVPYSGATTNVELGEYGVEAGFITLDTTPTNTPTDQGTIFWDADDETVDIVLNGYTMKIGEDLFYPVKNQTGSTIAKGVAVRFNGTVGASGRLLIAPFIADGSVPSSRFMGVTAEEILNGEDGKVLYFGRVRGINTNAFNEGDILYASTTSAGGYQTAIPVAPNNIVQVAAVVTKSATVGTIFVRPTLGSNINKDEGVKIVSVADKNLLQYQSGTSLWENKSLAQVIGSDYVPSTRTITINGTSQDLSANRTYNVGTVTSVGLSSATSGVTIGSTPVTTSGTITLAIATASGSQNGLLSSTDWTTFNNKQNALTNPVTGTGASGQVAYFNGTTSITSESNLFWDATNDRLGIGTPSPPVGLSIQGTNSDSVSIQLKQNAVGGRDYRITSRDDGSLRINDDTAGSERMRIFSGGNIHIGPTPASDNGARLQVSGAGRFTGTIFANTQLNNTVISPTDATNITNGFNLLGSQSYWGIRTTTAGNFALDVYGAGSTRNALTILQASGSVGIGTTSPSSGLELGSGLDLKMPSNGNIIFGNSNVLIYKTSGQDGLSFNTGGSERMRITSGGYFKASTNGTYVSSGGYHELRTNQNARALLITNSSTTLSQENGLDIIFTAASPNNATSKFIVCEDTSAFRFIVYSNGNVANTNNSYGSISDIKLKENIIDASPKLDDLMKVKVRNYNLIGEKAKQIGVIAQELEEIFPAMVDESIDKDKDGNDLGTTTKSVKYSVFVPMLIKAIQELKQEIDTLKN